ncbi:MAG: hypothetical protein ACLUAJ_13900 [Ruminococcus bicirculans (ex Wegman et al. 2014)]|uniref:hypothetical protein n=1 Tax=Ruminococcus bicirculans (ex Wegman et al. 2014) TaxID=1160721 RepID=UPI0039923BA4
MNSVTASPSRPQLDRQANGNATHHYPSLRSGILTAEKKKPSETLTRAFPRACGYSVPIEFVPVVVCPTMLNRTCVERKTGAPVGYGYWGKKRAYKFSYRLVKLFQRLQSK